MINRNYHIVLFDGHCNLCSGAVQWIIRRDKKDKFRFASLQSPIAAQLLKNIDTQALNSMVLVTSHQMLTESNAALAIARLLPFPWCWLGQEGLLLPQGIRNYCYRWIAQHRYRWWGQKKECWVPNPALQAKFLS
ncbi:MAG TPA: thiol-disulfide oxidoreductase DCC [Chitinophagaceae bacterium]|nr:thiol-disulfide oxidoreductase DCC [Chitinophagaceae bacterium]